MTLLIEHPYRGHELLVGPDPDGGGWAVSVWFGTALLAWVVKATEAAALREAKRRVDLLVEKPR